MTNIERAQQVLTRMAELLRIGGINDWAAALDARREQVGSDPKAASSVIRSWYGGAGSLNDVVLYKGGAPLIAENNELHALRSELYELVDLFRAEG